MLLAIGSAGPQVKKLQEVLNFVDGTAPPLAVDGIFGPLTRNRVTAFQGRVNLQQDGIAGPLTASALFTAALAVLSPAYLFGPTPLEMHRQGHRLTLRHVRRR